MDVASRLNNSMKEVNMNFGLDSTRYFQITNSKSLKNSWLIAPIFSEENSLLLKKWLTDAPNCQMIMNRSSK